MKRTLLNALKSTFKRVIKTILHPRVHYIFIVDESGLYNYFKEIKKKLLLKLPMVSVIYLHDKKVENILFSKELKSFQKRFHQQFILHFIKYNSSVPEDASYSIQRILELEINCSLRKRIKYKFYGSNELAYIVSEKIELLRGKENHIQSHIILTNPINQTAL